MFTDYCTTTKYLVLIEETYSDYPFLFRTTSNLYVAKMIVDNYIAVTVDSNPDAKLIENEVSTHPDMEKSWRLELNCNIINICIYKVKNVEIKT